LFLFSARGACDEKSDLEAAVSETAAYVLKNVENPQVGSVGGEWRYWGSPARGTGWTKAIFRLITAWSRSTSGLRRSAPQKKYTEYSRVILALTSIGKDPADVAGYNLLTPLGDYDKTIWQGLNGPIWALIALDSGAYPIPQNAEAKTQATRDMYVDRILACQLPDGGFSLFGGTAAATKGDMIADPDITAMALQALAKYASREDVARVIDEALTCLSLIQDEAGGFSSWGTTNSESVSQVIVALGELGISIDDERFVKNGYTLLDNLLTYRIKGGGFKHTRDGAVNQMATEQAFYALVSVLRNLNGKSSLYRISDALALEEGADAGPKPGEGLKSKDPDVAAQKIVRPNISFGDLPAENPHKNQAAILALASRGIINGYEDGSFRPDGTMTRAEYAAITVKALGLSPSSTAVFADVPAESWYAPYVGAAYKCGIVGGRSATSFDPSGTINRQEAAVMTARAARLCGMDTAMDTVSVRDMLAQFTDYVKISSWAREATAFCYGSGILDQSDIEVLPMKAVTRGEIAQMLFNMLSAANLL
jgi:hypothetical protein